MEAFLRLYDWLEISLFTNIDKFGELNKWPEPKKLKIE